ncbi:probable WRKY transcription factor 69 [Punica granatum]|uniref:WRKY domain-containing protein n=2 Tax=Punica granatum TaxID=22663 RepID=A0A218X1X5_PUNGR|nr:probable WRKY transcription factor 69 [Punica granatum]OWM78729.1 hypothetical protein CDL15_Pgr002900 [Punica granatum]PKI44016.1 hypothetical protein CRG98_035601 [Punica granatum]
MERKSYGNPFVLEHPEDHPDLEPQNGPDPPSSEDETTRIGAPSPKKRKGIQKRVVSIPIDRDVNGARSKGEAYPPPDSWTWRKYGQKPIKGSPYPRGYYRCSSSKGCPARKQVERSRMDPTTLRITYSYDHEHTSPAQGHSPAISPVANDPPQTEVSLDLSGFTGHPDLRCDAPLDLDWLAADVASTSLMENPVWTAGYCNELGADLAVGYDMMREEDETLFADLGELPECTTVFGRKEVDRTRRSRRLSAVPHAGSIG